METKQGLGSVAQSLARNPLSIIALFLMFVYYLACQVLTNAKIGVELQPVIVWFIVIFPCLILVIFYRLVTKHCTKLYSPQDFREDKSYLQAISGTQDTSLGDSFVRISSGEGGTQPIPNPEGNSTCEEKTFSTNVIQFSNREVAAANNSIGMAAVTVSPTSIGQVYALFRDKQYQEALDLANELLVADPGDSCLLMLRVKSLALMNSHEAALADVSLILNTDTTNIEAHVWRAYCLYCVGRSNEAILQANFIIALDPQNFWASNFLSFLYKNTGQYAQSLAALNHTLELAPNDNYVLAMRGDVNIRLGRIQEAYSDADNVITRDNKNVYAYAVRAEALFIMGRYDEAIRDANTTLRLDPGNLQAIIVRAWAYLSQNRLAEAITDCNEVLKHEPNNGLALQVRAECNRLNSSFESAIRDASSVLAVTPGYVFALRTRAEAARRLGRFEEAIRDASHALTIEPDNAFAARTISLAINKQSN